MTKVDLITGFLGAGKTTFLRRYAQYLTAQGNRIAILENDFGAVNIDMALLQDLRSDRCQLEMISGGGDPGAHRRRLRTQLIALGMQHFDRIVMEPSGIFDMDAFFDTLYEPPLDRWFEAGTVLTVADAEMPDTLSPQMEYLLGSEAACCGKLLLSKLGQDPQADAERTLSHINRALESIRCDRRLTRSDILAQDWDSLTDADFAAISAAGLHRASYVKRYRTETMQSAVNYFMHIAIPSAQIAPTVQAVMSDPACGQIYRIKGSLPDGAGGWLKLNATHSQTELAPIPDGQAVLIVIGEGISRAAVDAHLRAVNTDPEYVSV